MDGFQSSALELFHFIFYAACPRLDYLPLTLRGVVYRRQWLVQRMEG